MNCVKCNKPPQLPVTLTCNDVYCFLCLKEYMGNNNSTCYNQQCKQPITIDINHISEDFKTVLSGLNGKNVWMYNSVSNDGWWIYNPETSNNIEQCYSNGLPTVSFLIGTKTYRILFSSGVQTLISVNPTNGNGKQRTVKRVTFTQTHIDQLNIKGVAGIYFKTIEDQIGKFV
jgi:WWE domain